MIKRLFILTLLLISKGTLFSQGTWERKADLPVYIDRAVAFSINGIGYVGTGSNNVTLINDFWSYNPTNDEWVQIESMPTSGRRGAFCFVIGNKAYVGGGVNENSSIDRGFWEYDAQRDKWSKKNDLSIGHFSDGTLTGFSVFNRGYLLASFNSQNFFEYNPENDTWTNKMSFPGEGRLDQVGFSIGDKGYIGSGFAGFRNSSEFWEYDPSQNLWTYKGEIPGTPRNGAVGFSNGENGYIGLGINRAVLLSDFWEYDPKTDSWLEIATAENVGCRAYAFSIGSKGYVGTGIFSRGQELWEYTPESTSVSYINQATEFSIYPNPASDWMIIKSAEVNDMNISVFTLQGVEVISRTVSNQNLIDISHLSEGLYIIHISAGKEDYLQKIIISR